MGEVSYAPETEAVGTDAGPYAARWPLRDRLREAVAGCRAYLLIAGMWSRSTLTYRVSFLMTVVGNACMTALDFVTIAIIFGHTRTLGGFTLAETAFLYGSSGVAIGLADLLLGSLDGLGRRVRDGTVDALLVRPVPIFAQVAADRFALRRLGRLTQAAVVLVWSLIRLHVAWTPGRALLLPVMAVSGAAIFGAFYTAGAALQFRAGDAAEVQSSFTHGGGTMTQYPPTLFARELVRGAVFVVPVAFVNWMPALWILGRPEPLGLPGWTGWLSPAVALAVCALAGLAWRAGLRSYRSTGS